MTTFLSLLPLYLIGNLHCMGMCGPLVALIGKHRYANLYFLGRACSYALTGAIAGSIGAVLNYTLHQLHLSAYLSFAFGFIFLGLAYFTLSQKQLPGLKTLANKLAPFNHKISSLLLKDQPWPTFLFGFFTIALPCGQTVMVFSAIALSGNFWVGLFNGFAFALLTSPSLWVSMRTFSILRKGRSLVPYLEGGAALIIAILAFCRGAADLDIIPHLVLNQKYHLVIY